MKNSAFFLNKVINKLIDFIYFLPFLRDFLPLLFRAFLALVPFLTLYKKDFVTFAQTKGNVNPKLWQDPTEKKTAKKKKTR